MPANKFVHFTALSSYSLLEGAISVNQLAQLAREKKIPALALTDNHNLFGALEFCMACVKAGIKPIVGCHVNIVSPISSNHEQPELDAINLYAKNQQGWQSLLKLISNSYVNPIKPGVVAITYQQLAQHHHGLIALSAGPSGTIGKLLLQNKQDQALSLTKKLNQLFDDNRFYLEISRHGKQSEQITEPQLLNFAEQLNIPVIATNLVKFESPKNFKAHDALVCIANGTYIEVDERPTSNAEYYFKTTREMERQFKDIPQAINNSYHLAERINMVLEPQKPMMPKFAKTVAEEADILKQEATAGLKHHLTNTVLPSVADDIKQETENKYYGQLEYELKIINKLKYAGYFLIVSDFIRWSKSQQIPVGPGRGSGAGSIVAWSLNITDLDPLKFGLIFERFLNPERVSMPDFDIDFCQERRDEVINYVREKYGHQRVAQIITFGKLQARAVLRDVGRVMQLPYSYVDRISKLVPHNPVSPVSLSQALDIEPMLKKAQKEDPQIAELITISLQLEGLFRHASTHAAGLVIADRNLDELVALYADPKSDIPVVQYSMKYAESAGLVKFDFLGLKTLTTIAETCKQLALQDTELNVSKLPLDNETTYDLLSQGLGTGVFQFESKGMRDSLIKLKPDTIHEIIALGALYRPGPMENIPRYIAVKHGLEEAEYPHPMLEELLKETFGVIIYQEQVLEIAKIMAGYSLGSADLLRRAMGKKIKAEMDAQRKLFIDGAVNNGVDRKKASEVFDLVARFAGYGFNKAHAAAYGMISYQTAYLKANYPAEFLVASMNLDLHDSDKLYIFASEARTLNITVLPVDINKSDAKHKVESDDAGEKCIRYGLGALKAAGIAATNEIVNERQQSGNFTDIFNMVERLDTKILNKRCLESLIKSGACDCLGHNRASLLSGVEMLVKLCQAASQMAASAQVSLFDVAQSRPSGQAKLPEVPLFDFDQKLQAEYEAYGFYLFSHPLERYQLLLDQVGINNISQIDQLEDGNHSYMVGGVIVDFAIKLSKRGRFAFMSLSDLSGTTDISIYNEDLLDNQRHLLEKKQLVAVKIDVRKEPDNLRLVVVELQPLEDYIASKGVMVNIAVNKDQLVKLKQFISNEHNKCKLSITLPTSDGKYQVKMRLPGGIAAKDVNDIREAIGSDLVVESC